MDGGEGQCFKQSTLQEDKVDVSTLICQSLRQGCEASHLRNPGDEVAPRRATVECGKRIITIIMTKTRMVIMMMTKTKTSMTIRQRGRGREPHPLLGCNNNAPQKLHIL